MSFGSFELAFLTITLLLPGYIIDLILRSKRIRKSEESQIAFFRWLVLGTVAELPWLVVGFLVLAPHSSNEQEAWAYIVDNRYAFALGWVIAIFAWPLVVGRLAAHSEAVYLERERDGFLHTCLAIIGRTVAAQAPINDDSAWDTKFTSLEGTQGQWVLVELVDGTWIAGLFGQGSDASVDPNERDLYLARVLYTSLEEHFPGLERPGGVLIPAGQIRVIHFWE